MDVSNASLYDGGSAVAEAILMALASGEPRTAGSSPAAPSIRNTGQIAETYLANLEPELVTVPARNGRTSIDDLAAAITDDTAAVVLQQPNVFGQIEDIEPLVAAGPGPRGHGDRQRRPDQPRPPATARRLRGRHRHGRGAVARQRPGLRRAVPRHPRLPRVVPPEDPRPARRPDDRPRRAAAASS